MTATPTKEPSAGRTDKSIAAVTENELRHAIWIALTERIRGAMRLSKELREPFRTVNLHVNRLLEYGAIEWVRDRQVRGATEHLYRSVKQPIVTEEEMRALTPEQATAINRLIARLSVADIQHALDGGTFVQRPEHICVRTPMVLDERGWRELTAFIAEVVFPMVEKVRIESAERIGLDPDNDEGIPEGGIRATALLYLFETPHAEVRDD